MYSDDPKEEFDDLAALVVSSIKARERKKKTKRRRGDILKLSLSISLNFLYLCYYPQEIQRLPSADFCDLS